MMNACESNVRSYSRLFPAEFSSAQGAFLIDRDGKQFLDFLSGCGSLNYGHNHPVLKEALIDYVASSGVSMSLDLCTSAKLSFMEALHETILSPAGLDYKIQFTGPTGTNAVEAAIKLARKATGRWGIVAFTNGFHGCSLGALAATGSSHHRGASEPLLTNVVRMPFDQYLGADFDTTLILEKMLGDPSSGIGRPAAILVESIQGEGGLNVARNAWLTSLARIAKKYDILLILDEIQSGCGRSGTFMSFQRADVRPDIVVLAKAISGYGLPLALVLLRPDLDCWAPGEHNGTFRGNNLAFVTGAAALRHFWQGTEFVSDLATKASYLSDGLASIAAPLGLKVKGLGLMQGIDMISTDWCSAVQKACFQKGLIVEAAGPRDEVLKLMPPLTVTTDEISYGLGIIQAAIEATEPADRVRALTLPAAVPRPAVA